MISNFIGFTINPDDKLSETDKQIQLALGFGLGKRAFYGEENHYYLNDNEIICFNDYDQTYNNILFRISEQEKRFIWFSQFKRFFINPYKREYLGISNLYLHHHDPISIIDLYDYEFIKHVENKKFEVRKDNNAIVYINPKNEMVQKLKNPLKIRDYIWNKIDNKEYKDIKGMTKAGELYDLYEV